MYFLHYYTFNKYLNAYYIKEPLHNKGGWKKNILSDIKIFQI